jgi:hypothetical protein
VVKVRNKGKRSKETPIGKVSKTWGYHERTKRKAEERGEY